MTLQSAAKPSIRGSLSEKDRQRWQKTYYDKTFTTVNYIYNCTTYRYYIITYLVSSIPYIEICRVCKIYGRRFYVRSGTDQISGFFCQGPFFVYAVLCKIRKFIRSAGKLTTSMLAWKCDVASCATSHMTSLTPVWKSRLTLRFCGFENQGKSNITWL